MTVPSGRVVLAVVLPLFLIGTAALELSHLAMSSFLNFDEAYNLQVPSHVAKEGRYATNGRYARKDRPSQGSPVLFDPLITTGPTVLVPIAAGYRLGGAPLAQRGRQVVLAFALVGLLVPIVFALSRPGGAVVAVVVGLVGIVLTRSPGWIGYFVRVVGEGPGTVFFLLGALLPVAGAARETKKTWFLRGLLFGLAVLTKVLCLVPLAGLFAIELVARLRRGREDPLDGRGLPRLADFPLRAFGAGFVAPGLVWQVIQLVSLGLASYLDLKLAYAGLFRGLNGGAVTSTRLLSSDWWAEAMARFTKTLLPMFRPPTLALFCVAGLAALLWQAWKRDPARSPEWRWLLAAGSTHVAWFVLLSPVAWDRYVVSGVTLLAIGAAGVFGEALLVAAGRSVSGLGERLMPRWPVSVGALLIGVFLIRRPPEGHLREDILLQAVHARIDAAFAPVWIAQIPEGFNPYLATMAETNATPLSIPGRPDRCGPLPKDLLPPDRHVAMLREPEDRHFAWRCRAPLRISYPPVEFHPHYLFEMCASRDLVCVPPPNPTP